MSRHHNTIKLTDAFVQSEIIALPVGETSKSVAIPDGHESLVITYPSGKLTDRVWLSFGGKGTKVVAVVGVGHQLNACERLHVLVSPGVAQVAAIMAPHRDGTGAIIHIEVGMGGATERRHP